MREAEAMRMGLGRGFQAVTESTEATERLQKDHDEAEERSKGDETHGRNWLHDYQKKQDCLGEEGNPALF